MFAALTTNHCARTSFWMRTLSEECCGWNRKTWADAVEFAVAMLPGDLRGKMVLEIGASDRSTVAPIFAAQGAQAFCSYYKKPPGFIENAHLSYIRSKYRLDPIPTFETSITEIEGRFDVIIMKSVLGGICRNDNYQEIRTIIHKLLKDNLVEGGVILTIDNGSIGPFHRLRRYLGTGGNSWSYLERDKLAASLSDFQITMKGFGYLNVASASLQFGRDCEFLNTFVYYIDRAMIPIFNPTERAVLSTVIRGRSAYGSTD
jgi:hypothetical protein